MKSKILIFDNKIHPLSKVSNFLKQKKFEVVKPTETQSVFNICTKDNVGAVIIDLRLFGKKSNIFIQNLKENVLPEHVKLITVSNHTSPRQIFNKITFNT